MEGWIEWEETQLSGAVAVACNTRDAGDLSALLAGTLEKHLAATGGSLVRGAAGPTLADVCLWAALYPILAEGGVCGLKSCPAVAAWYNKHAALAAFASGVEGAKASGTSAVGRRCKL